MSRSSLPSAERSGTRPLRTAYALFTTIVCSLIGLAAACSGNSDTPTPSDAGAPCSANLASIQQTIFQHSCVAGGCHSGATPAADLDLSGDAESLLVNVPSSLCPGAIRIVPGRPSDSLLYQKIAGSQSCGAAMPVGGKLTPEERLCIEDWILGLPLSDAGTDAPDGGCATGLEDCGGSCVDTTTDSMNCGGCGKGCGASEVCVAGTCGCSGGLSSCNGTCTDTNTDAANCGTCGAACPAGASCTNGSCVCSGGQELCNGKCIDTQLDANNCGGCGKGCPTGSTCASGTCACPAGQDVCGNTCVDTSSDPTNCGTCGTVCAPAQFCAAGACTFDCGQMTLCNSTCVDLQTNASNCGACGKACPTGASCVAGMCACPPGTSDCGGSCINTTTDANNCGTCGNTCASGQSCSGGVCSCPNNGMLCNGTCVDITTSPTNCGACGVVCPVPLSCTAGVCACSNGGTVCGGACVDTQTDTSNCGMCGNTCALGQTCVSGACTCAQVSVSFAANVQPIFTANCTNAGCHSGPVPAEGMSLAAGSSYSSLVNVTATECMDGRKRVLPGQPSQSYLIDKLMGVDLCFGTQMPKIGMIPQTDIQTISNWICAGAPNN